MTTFERLRAHGGAALFAAALFACGTSTAPDPGERARGTESARSGTGGEAAARGARQGALKLASWNLSWLNKKSGTGPVKRSDDDYARLRRYAESLDADVIALQEVDGPDAAARVFDPEQYHFHFATQNDPQRTGFAYRKTLSVRANPDYAALDVGQVRAGADLSVLTPTGELRLLSVHLKAGCFADALTSQSKDCRKLAMQVPSLEAWIDARGAAGEAAIVLGDFNRRLFRGGAPDEFWQALDDGDPPASDLFSPTEGRTAKCWSGKYPVFIDHIAFNAPASALFVADSFEELVYDASDVGVKSAISDHCPIAVVLRVDGSPNEAPSPVAAREIAPSDATPASTEQRIKGNIGRSGRKLYHAPNCPEYARTVIDESKGERFFATAAEAEASGFTRASNCP